MSVIHYIYNYDLEDRTKAMWEGFKTQFTKEEYKRIKRINEVKLLKDFGKTVIVKYEPKKEDWEDLLK